MSYKRAIEQLRPVRIPKEDVQEKTQRYLLLRIDDKPSINYFFKNYA